VVCPPGDQCSTSGHKKLATEVADNGFLLPELAAGITNALADMLATFAEFERDIIRDRVKAGIAQAGSAERYLLANLPTPQIGSLSRSRDSISFAVRHPAYDAPRCFDPTVLQLFESPELVCFIRHLDGIK
jgi:hypothetical protein